METFLLQQQYLRDRRKLLDFILSTDLIKEIRTPSGAVDLSDVDLDTLSADYVLECVRSGGVLDVSEATKKYYDEFGYPAMISSPLGSCYFLMSDPELSGSPPRRVPPQIELNPSTKYTSHSLNQSDPFSAEDIENSGDENGVRHTAAAVTPCQPKNDANIPLLGLPFLSTGLSDDDLQETAYEILLASVVFSGVQVYSSEDKKEKKSRLLSRLRSRRDKVNSQSQTANSHSELLDIIRIQMQISEPMDTCTRQRLMQFTTQTRCGQIDVIQIAAELLNTICKSDFLNEKSYMRWKKRQTNILEEVLYYSGSFITDERASIGSFLAKIKDSEEWDLRMYPSNCDDVLLAVRRFASKLSSGPGKFGIPGETYYWTGGYHLNIKLYEKLLFSVFDILEEGQLVEEADKILEFIKLTWSTLGITQKMHSVLYGWILFQKFVETGEVVLLECATLEMQKVLPSEDGDGKEAAYMNSLTCSIVHYGKEIYLNLMDTVFVSMSIWCDSKLEDYHLHFSQKPINFGRVVTLVTVVGILAADECGDLKLTQANAGNKITSRHFKEYIERSIQAAYRRVRNTLDPKSKAEKRHPLAVLADELKLIVEREFTVFSPVICHWCPEAGKISSMLLHQLYGERLKPFLDGVSCLSEDVRSVLPAADMLECDLIQLYCSTCGEDKIKFHVMEALNHYQIGEVGGPIILDWVSAQNEHILEWIEHAFDFEDWEPLSFQQRQSASIIEVFRIIEETVDQFFSLNIPMDIIHLQSLLSVIFRSLEAYVLKVINQLVEKNHMFPVAPALTRHKETSTPLIKKKSIECTLLKEEVHKKLNDLTISKLCVMLNTLQYIANQIDTLEDGIRQSWMLVRPCLNQRWKKEQHPKPLREHLPACTESVDELFTTFNSIGRTAAAAIDTICDFIGAKVVFWDLRDSFLFLLYRGDVESARLEIVLPQLDTILDHICGLITDTLRDPVALSVCRASLEGFVWVLLDGGPSRVFSDTDIQMMQEDLNILKDFFVADGEGLPRAVVEQEAYLALQLIELYSLQTETVIGMLMTASKQISTVLDCRNPGSRCVEDAYTLLRVLCHKKDREASKFLKRQYQFPKSSEYDDTVLKGSTSTAPFMSDLLKRSASFHWPKKSQRSFKLIKKKLQEATSEIREAAW